MEVLNLIIYIASTDVNFIMNSPYSEYMLISINKMFN
jgi:hypothetical protein